MEYRVLARKYRPKTFDDLIGQEVLVRTLSNAIARNRVAHAFLLHGIRGIGKTTTARIIARALNCVGADGRGGATIQPCGVCNNCVAIAEDRHIDVIEMDAASRTGVDDIRDLIETIQYAPGMARTKVYIIDEVHMLSKNAFNALLKTLEEPPPYAKFIFATTELRKIPVTILSRCQKFDLRRVEVSVMMAHLADIALKENVSIGEDDLKRISAAAEGSVRDALSLLDQAIALGEDDADAENGRITVPAGTVSQMLGMADRARMVTLLEYIYSGQVSAALEALRSQYADGNDPAMVLQDLMERVHEISLLKIAAVADGVEVAPEYQQLKALSDKLSLGILTRSWQVLAKGMQELTQVSNALAAAEMVLIRLSHLSDLPDPGTLIRKLKAEGVGAVASTPSAAMAAMQSAPAPVASANENAAGEVLHSEDLASFERVVDLFKRKREVMLAHYLTADTNLVSFARGRMELRFTEAVARNTPSEITAKLKEWTGENWVVAVSQSAGQPTLKEQQQQRLEKEQTRLRAHPLVESVLRAFPNAQIKDIKTGV